VIEGGALDAGIVEVLPEMVWYDEALAAPDPVAALGYAADQVTAGRPIVRQTSDATCGRSRRRAGNRRGSGRRPRRCASASPGATGRAGRRRRP